jgi:2Fe-2S ferredoxin
VIEFDRAKAPFHHDGRPGSILDILLGHKIHLEHACGGNCACTTCHVVIKDGFDKLSEPEESEEDMLDKAPGLTPTSRLGCQAVVEDPNAEITVVIPRFTINLVSESRDEQ